MSSQIITTVDGCVITIPNTIKTDDPIIVLFGWAGCRDELLKKYTQIYQDFGLTTIRYTSTMQVTDGIRVTDSNISKPLIDAFKRLHLTDITCKRTFLYHIFSMNGCQLFCALWKQFDSIGIHMKRRVEAVIFDSAPAFSNLFEETNVWMTIAKPPKLLQTYHLNILWRPILFAYFIREHLQLYVHSFIDSSIYSRQSLYYHLMSLRDLPRRQLYIYSLADQLCRYDSIESFQRYQQQSRSAYIDHVCFDDSPHVEHGRKYPREYNEAVSNFLKQTVLLRRQFAISHL